MSTPLLLNQNNSSKSNFFPFFLLFLLNKTLDLNFKNFPFFFFRFAEKKTEISSKYTYLLDSILFRKKKRTPFGIIAISFFQKIFFPAENRKFWFLRFFQIAIFRTLISNFKINCIRPIYSNSWEWPNQIALSRDFRNLKIKNNTSTGPSHSSKKYERYFFTPFCFSKGINMGGNV